MKTTTVGERVIAPYLWKKGISHSDEIIVTHPDADHYHIRHRPLQVLDKGYR